MKRHTNGRTPAIRVDAARIVIEELREGVVATVWRPGIPSWSFAAWRPTEAWARSVAIGWIKSSHPREVPKP